MNSLMYNSNDRRETLASSFIFCKEILFIIFSSVRLADKSVLGVVEMM